MKYFEWAVFAPRLPNGECCWTMDIPDFRGSEVRNDGRRVRGWNSKVIGVYADAFAEFDFASIGIHSIRVFSARLQRFFKSEYPGLIQFLPLRLQRDDGTLPMHGFALGKFLSVVDCIDRTRSQCELCLRSSAIRDSACFLVYDAWSYTIVREDLRDRLEDEGFLGCRFSEVRISKS